MQKSKLLRRVKTIFLSNQMAAGTIRFGVFSSIKTVAVPTESVQIRLGLWEREAYKYIRKAAKIARWVIDIGAGIDLNHSRNIEVLAKYLGCSSRRCRRQTGRVYSSLTLRPRARGWAKRRWCASLGVRRARQGMRGKCRGSADARSTLLSAQW